jgi:parallel beta-helix repeat protein
VSAEVSAEVSPSGQNFQGWDASSVFQAVNNPPPPTVCLTMFLAIRRIALFGSLLLAMAAAAAPITFHVSTNGRDEWSGTRSKPTFFRKDGPFATVGRALQAARSARTGSTDAAVIEIETGRYELAEPIVFRPEDSHLEIRSAPGATVELSGGRRVTGWKRSETNASLWRVTLPEVKAGTWYFRQLFVDGARAVRARTPNVGFFRAAGPLSPTSPIDVPIRPEEARPEWAGQGELFMLMKWTSFQVPILAVDTNAKRLRIPGAKPAEWMDEKDARYWIENTPDALDQPGEWQLDRQSGVLSYWAPAGADPNRARVVAPKLDTLVRWEGDLKARRAVTDVALRGLRLTDADCELPAEGRIDPQAASQTRGTLRAEFATHCVIEDCVLTDLGGYGLELRRGCQNWRVVGNDFHSLGAGGIRIGEQGDRDPDGFTGCHTHSITDNDLHQLGRIMPPAVGIIVFQSGTNRIAHNHIHDLFYTGISVGWNWGYRDTPCRANVIEFNLVHDVGQGLLSDMGGIYTLGPQPGTIIRNNVFHDIRSYAYGGWGLYTDEGSSGILLENNVVYRCKDAGFHQHYGRDNVVRNNLLAFNLNHSVMRSRAEEHRSFWFTNNVVIADSGTLLGSNWNGTTNNYVMAGNVWFDTRSTTNAEVLRFADRTFPAWQASGQGAGSIVADPQLKDPQHPEAGLKPGSPAFTLGFKPIDVSTVGPRPAGRRD